MIQKDKLLALKKKKKQRERDRERERERESDWFGYVMKLFLYLPSIPYN